MLLKPGQLCTINKNVFRAKRRIAGCKGCFFNEVLLCPSVKYKNKSKKIDCILLDIILVKV